MKRKKIFICDDDRGITDMLQMIFQLSDVDVVVENNSVLAYDAIVRLMPDVVIVDLWMPVVSGDLLIKNIKGNPLLRDVYVICISASRDGKAVATEAGADRFIAKPFDLDDVLHAIDEGPGIKII
ncbi:response regulator [Sphingobacterium griseoflavum]|uniref:Response regulatory domain-containing protein n=1 Tax=Sphingobacterium griseoflavum TaxID=1474952 RepID=A0ABQ3HU77_9SPHI|nr:response regulator [Sphingobacterium griseoflavum]GHE34030.1 hypothetical protein GCM10017764_16670 [Sphingobacterium griseoflavum]